MKLTESQRDLVIKKLDELWQNPKVCTVCHHSNWIISDTLFEIRNFNKGNLVLGGGSLLPVAVAICSNCGHILFFSAIQLGLVEPPAQEKKNG